jgi:transketolase
MSTTTDREFDELHRIATQIRRDILRMVHGAQSGHPGGSLGCTEFFTALYFHLLQHRPQPFRLEGKHEDVFILSNGHISPVYYSALARAGYFQAGELATFRKIDSRLQGHPTTHEGLPGIRTATGSLGQGLSVAIGMALAKRMDEDKHLVYALLGDGELQEGQNWEALMFAAHHLVDNLIATVDCNNQQIDGTVHQVMNLGNLSGKFQAFGWKVLEMDGNNMRDVVDTLRVAQSLQGQRQPIAILMRTRMGCGVDFMEDDHRWHGVAPSDEQLERALAQLPETLGDF